MTRPKPSRRRGAALVAAAAMLLLLPVQASAHAELLETTPEDGATVQGAPGEIVAVFNEDLLPNGSGISVRDDAGERVASGDVDPDDAARLLIANVPDLPPGEYEVRWTARSDDGHLERDTWTFTIEAAPTPAPSATPEPTPTASVAPASPVPSASTEPAPTTAPTLAPTDAPSAEPSPAPADGDTSSSGGDVILPILAGLAIVAVGGALLMGRRGRPSSPA